MRLKTLLLTLAAGSLPASAQTGFTSDWQSLSQYEVPQWFRDAKFGIWAHWGPQCEAEDGDWYARHMYYAGSEQNQWHRSHYGDPKDFGLKDLCNEWKAENWNPKELVELYKSVGAKYFMVLANHHDNMDLWDSPYQEWNSVNVGPRRDIVGEWAEASREAGLPLGVSVHASHAWTWLEPSQAYDGNLTKEDGYTPNADGSDKWWKGLDPQELYAQNHPHSSGWENIGSIHAQWDWGNGAALPSEEYKLKMMNRTMQLVTDYAPDMIYFDDTVLPFYGCDDEWGTDFLSNYYNLSAEKNSGFPQVVVTGKQLLPQHKEAMVWDVERGIPDRMQEKYWQTCTCIGEWHYSQAVYNRNGYKSAATVIRMLADVISKNGNLLLNIPVKGDGTIDEKERKILSEIKEWMDVNSKAVYGTHVWKTFGEGPLADADNPMNAQGFNEGLNYTSSDVRFVEKDGIIYATIMAWPGEGDYTLQSFAPISEYYSGNVTDVTLLGYGALPYSLTSEGLVVTFPSQELNSIAPVLAIETDNSEISPEGRLENLIEIVETFLDSVVDRASYYNTGMYNLAYIPSLESALEKARHADDVEDAFINLKKAYDAFDEASKNKGDRIVDLSKCESDITLDKLGENGNFSRSNGTSRFGRPAKWTVENFSIPNGGDGVKEGLDSYSGREALMLGVWNDRAANKDGNLENARIYQTVTLPRGLYFFGGAYNTTYNITSDAYMFIADALCNTPEIPEKAMAYYKVADCSENVNEYNGLYFYLPEEKEVIIGWQADLQHGSETQEFRVERVALLKMPEIDANTLTGLIEQVETYVNAVHQNNRVNDNTGSYTEDNFNRISDALQAAKDNANNSDIQASYFPLKYEWEQFLASRNPATGGIKDLPEDITTEKFVETNAFTPTDNDGLRFAAPKYWTVENFSIPNGAEGTKAGLDSYTNTYALMLGIWDDRGRNQEGSLENARIYRKIHLDAGEYYFGAQYNALFNLHEAYMFVMPELAITSEIPLKALSHMVVSDAKLDKEYYGLRFTVTEPGDYYIGWQADLEHGGTCQEFRAEHILMLASFDNSGIDEIFDKATTADSTPEEYYNIQGFRLSTPPAKGMYIIRKGSKAYKVIR